MTKHLETHRIPEDSGSDGCWGGVASSWGVSQSLGLGELSWGSPPGRSESPSGVVNALCYGSQDRVLPIGSLPTHVDGETAAAPVPGLTSQLHHFLVMVLIARTSGQQLLVTFWNTSHVTRQEAQRQAVLGPHCRASGIREGPREESLGGQAFSTSLFLPLPSPTSLPPLLPEQQLAFVVWVWRDPAAKLWRPRQLLCGGFKGAGTL